ncbi:MAG: Fic family protein [Candidatus Aenigmatarchaeota archaeon]
MAYLIKKLVKGKTYFYLASNVRTDGKWKKIQVYVGKKKPSPKQLSRYSRVLRQRVRQYQFSKDPLLTLVSEADLKALEKVKTSFKKLSKQSKTVREKYYEWFITTFTYDSNAIEGSALTLRETSMVLFEGITPPGRPLRDVRAAENHKAAFDWMVSYKGDISKSFVLKLHKVMTRGILPSHESGKIRKAQVYIRGAREIPPKPKDVEKELGILLSWYKNNKKRYHPVVVASYFHTAFEQIHPFVDFNGRTGRLLLNFILLKNDFPAIDIRNKDRQRYYSGIRSAIAGNLKPFVTLVIKYLKVLRL